MLYSFIKVDKKLFFQQLITSNLFGCVSVRLFCEKFMICSKLFIEKIPVHKQLFYYGFHIYNFGVFYFIPFSIASQVFNNRKVFSILKVLLI